MLMVVVVVRRGWPPPKAPHHLLPQLPEVVPAGPGLVGQVEVVEGRVEVGPGPPVEVLVVGVRRGLVRPVAAPQSPGHGRRTGARAPSAEGGGLGDATATASASDEGVGGGRTEHGLVRVVSTTVVVLVRSDQVVHGVGLLLVMVVTSSRVVVVLVVLVLLEVTRRSLEVWRWWRWRGERGGGWKEKRERLVRSSPRGRRGRSCCRSM